MLISFKDKRVIVTGGSRGIGRTIALAFASEGAHLAICARGIEGLKKTESELKRKGVKVFSMACDLGDGAAVTRYVTEAAGALNGADILINNASGEGMKDDEEGWLASVNIDLLATVRATRAATEFMEKAGGGTIVNIVSISSFMAVPRALPYAAVKAALVNYTRGQGLALASKRIRVNAVAPGSIDFAGGVWERRMRSDPELYQNTLRKIPWGRFGTTQEIANVALFLASDLASWMTGQTIVVDGGQLLS